MFALSKSAPMRASLTARGYRRHGFIGGVRSVGRRQWALDKAAAEHARLTLASVVKDAGLAGGNAILAVHEINLVAAVRGREPAGLRRPGRTHLHEHLAPLVGELVINIAFADPIDVAQHDATGAQRRARADHDLAAHGIEPHHIERRAGRQAQSAALADGEMDDAGMRAQHMALEIDDLASFRRARLQALDHVRVMAGRHEADVLAVMLVGNRQPELARQFARLGLAALAEREAQQVELLARGPEQEIALVALFLARAIKRAHARG